jgi:hypothetical protein
MTRERHVCASSNATKQLGCFILSYGEETMTGTDIAGLVVLLGVFVFVPVVLMVCFSGRAHGSTPRHRECPHCGAQNDMAKERCYCCGTGLILPQSDQANVDLIQRVKQADDSRRRRKAPAQAPQPIDDAVIVPGENK